MHCWYIPALVKVRSVSMETRSKSEVLLWKATLWHAVRSTGSCMLSRTTVHHASHLPPIQISMRRLSFGRVAGISALNASL
jgi:hypothetical protein